jgi:hypothetical protein
MFNVKEADSFHLLEGSKGALVMARAHFLFRGLSPRYEIRLEINGTWEILLSSINWKAANNPERKECGDR